MNDNIKTNLIEFLRNRGEFFRPVHNGWYNIRCPFCGDTQKNLKEGHLYLKIDPEENYPIGYNCFRCGEHGIVTDEIIEVLGGDNELKQNIIHLNKNSKKLDKKTIIDENKLMYFDYKAPQIKVGAKTDYIDKRLGIKFSCEDYYEMKVVTSLYDFIAENNLKKFPFNQTQLEVLEKYYVGFMTNGNSHIMFRDITDTQEEPWVKYPISKESMENKVFYSMMGTLDLFTTDDIEVNLSEGIMDAIGVAHHFNKVKDNTMNVAITGKRYEIMIYRLIQLGLIGSNVTVNIYSDNDASFGNKKNNYNTTLPFYKKTFSKYKPLFKKINVFYNMKSKDYGVPKDMISVKKEII